MILRDRRPGGWGTVEDRLAVWRLVFYIIPPMTNENDSRLSYAVWATAWGPMGGLTGPAGLRRIVLPHYQVDQLAELLAWEHPGAVRDEDEKPFERLIQLTRD